MTPEQKIAKAKALLFEATREIRAREKLVRANDRCTCGHRREEHTESYSINYTEGYCMVCPEVKGHSSCRWFNYDSHVDAGLGSSGAGVLWPACVDDGLIPKRPHRKLLLF